MWRKTLVNDVAEPAEAARLVEAAADRLGWPAVPRSALKTIPGSVHWHYRSGRREQSGIVEVTFLPAERQIEVSIHENRRGSWAMSAARQLIREIGSASDAGFVSSIENQKSKIEN